ncbi:hypothetical protein MPTK2_1g00130 [Marchantia polymorpha subsp. ruderalis]
MSDSRIFSTSSSSSERGDQIRFGQTLPWIPISRCTVAVERSVCVCLDAEPEVRCIWSSRLELGRATVARFDARISRPGGKRSLPHLTPSSAPSTPFPRFASVSRTRFGSRRGRCARTSCRFVVPNFRTLMDSSSTSGPPDRPSYTCRGQSQCMIAGVASSLRGLLRAPTFSSPAAITSSWRVPRWQPPWHRLTDLWMDANGAEERDIDVRKASTVD